MNKKLLIADEVAQLLRVDKQRIYELVRTKKLPVIKLGERQYRFSAEAIENFLNSGGTQSESKTDEK